MHVNLMWHHFDNSNTHTRTGKLCANSIAFHENNMNCREKKCVQQNLICILKTVLAQGEKF